MSDEQNITIKLLLDALTGTLAQLNLKYEAIQRSISHIEDIVSERNEVTENVAVLRTEIDNVKKEVAKIEDLTINIQNNLQNLTMDISGSEGVKTYLKEMKSDVKTVGHLARLIRKPIVWAIFIVGLLGSLIAINGIYHFYEDYVSPSVKTQATTPKN